MASTKMSEAMVRSYIVKDVANATRNKKEDVLLEINWRLFPSGFPEAATSAVVMKRYSDVFKLASALSAIHKGLYLKGTFPTVPKSPVAASDAVGLTLGLLEFAGKHQQLNNSQALNDFLYSGTKPPSDDSASAKSSLRLSLKQPDSTATATATATCSVRQLSLEQADLALQVTSLKQKGNLLDAAALSLHLARDDTPTLMPTPASTPSAATTATATADNTPVVRPVKSPVPAPSTLSAAAETSASSPSPAPSSRTSPDEEMCDLPSYLSDAAVFVGRAVQLEVDGDLDASLECYRGAIGTLLESVQADRCLKRQASVKRRIAHYINKAEEIVEKRNTVKGNSIAVNSPKLSSVRKIPHLDLLGNVSDLGRYRVSNVLANKVLLVRFEDHNNEEVVMKVLQKSALVFRRTRKSLLPVNVPHMVRLQRYYETDDAVFLVLQRMANGMLYDVVRPYIFDSDSNSATGTTASDSSSPEYPEAPAFGTTMVIRTSQSFVSDKTRRAADEVDNDEGVNVVQAGAHLLCVSKDGIEKIDCEEEEDEEERDEDSSSSSSSEEAYDFVNDLADEEGVDAGAEVSRLSHAPDLSSVQSRMLSHLSAASRSLTPHSSPFRRPARRHPESSSSSASTTPSTAMAGSNLPFIAELSVGVALPVQLVRKWACQLCRCVLSLHSRGIVVRDLNPKNLLLDADGDLRVTYQYEWVSVDKPLDSDAVRLFYTAPELSSPEQCESALPSADWWSVGAILFELATGSFLSEAYPSGLQLHTPVAVPDAVHPHLASLVAALLRFSQDDRLGGRDVKTHPFFDGMLWPNDDL